MEMLSADISFSNGWHSDCDLVVHKQIIVYIKVLPHNSYFLNISTNLWKIRSKFIHFSPLTKYNIKSFLLHL